MTWDEWHSAVVVHTHALAHYWAPPQTTAEICAGSATSSYVALEDMICCKEVKQDDMRQRITTTVSDMQE